MLFEKHGRRKGLRPLVAKVQLLEIRFPSLVRQYETKEFCKIAGLAAELLHMLTIKKEGPSRL
jgi:hypothetical protein